MATESINERKLENMEGNEQTVKVEVEDFYQNQSSDKTSDLDNWLKSGSSRIP